jgi:hypothetical protein
MNFTIGITYSLLRTFFYDFFELFNFFIKTFYFVNKLKTIENKTFENT